MIARLIFLLSLLFPISLIAHGVRDDQGQHFLSRKPVERIISLAPDLTEILFAAGAGSKIVGVVQGSNYPAAAKSIPMVASFNQIDVEKIVELHPDLIVVWSEGSLTSPLKKLGIPIFYSHQKKIVDVPYTLRRLGQLAGTKVIAEQAATNFEAQYLALQKQYQNKKIVTVFYEVWAKPLMTISQKSWINDAIAVCGGKNIFASLKGAAPQVNVEAVIMADPKVILGPNSIPSWRNDWLVWRMLQAVKNKNLYSVAADLLERAGPRIVLGTAEVCKYLDQARDKENG